MRTSIFFIFSFAFIACNHLKTDSYRSKVTNSIATQETAENVRIEYTDSGVLKAAIKSPVMIGVKKIKDPYVEMPKGIKVDFFNSNGGIESYLTAEYAISYSAKKMMVVKQKVEVLNVKGDTLNTEELVWDQTSGKISTDKFVVIKTKTQTISGEGMTSDQSFSEWEILHVTGTINK